MADLGVQSCGVSYRERFGEGLRLSVVGRVIRAAVGEGEVAPDAGHAQRATCFGGGSGGTQLRPVVGPRAVAPETRVDLQLHASGHAAGATGLLGRGQLGRRRDPEVDPAGHDSLDVLARGPQPAQHRDRDPGRADRERLLDEGDAEPGRTAGHRRLRRRDQPVAVAVGLHHRHDPGLPGARAQGGDVAPDRREVDDRLGPHLLSRTPHCPSRTAATARGHACRIRAALVGPPSAERVPLTPCRCAPTAPAMIGSRPCASSAPTPPDSTSPLPAVASTGEPSR